MPRYVARFEKGGYTKYISHLDLLRVFKRAFKVMGLDIKYSNGYNPHPKMSFAQPLSLGYSSLCEYLEFETITPHDPESLKEDLAKNLPRDLAITELFQFDSETTNLHLTISTSYELDIAVSQIAHHITCAVAALTIPLYVCLGCLLRQVQVSSAHLRTGHKHLSGSSQWKTVHILIYNV